jgi:Domain of unknown function (DUF4266)
MRDTRQIAPSGPARPVIQPPSPSPSPWRSGTSRLIAVVLLGAALGLAGCAHRPPPIQPWQREYLSKRAMRFDADPLEARFRQHMFGSREAADGGYGQPGGGCGCN